MTQKRNSRNSNWAVLIIASISALLLFFQNCAPGKGNSSSSSSFMPGIQSIEPSQNARIVEGALLCAGDCLITFEETADMRFSNITCGGNLTMSGHQLRCDNNLTLSN